MDRVYVERNQLSPSIELDNERYGGSPVIRGTRFPVAQVLAEVAEGMSLLEISCEYGIPLRKLEDAMQTLSVYVAIWCAE